MRYSGTNSFTLWNVQFCDLGYNETYHHSLFLGSFVNKNIGLNQIMSLTWLSLFLAANYNFSCSDNFVMFKFYIEILNAF